MKKSRVILFIIMILTSMTVSDVMARVTLSALPPREDVVVNVVDPDRAIVQETRTLPLQKGVNDIDFSWAGVQLDPTSVRLLLPQTDDAVSVLSVSYPPDDEALVWHVASDRAREVRVTIRYHLRGFGRDIEYRGKVDTGESRINLRENNYLFNHTGEDFSDAWLGLGEGNWRQLDWSSGQSKRLSVYRVDNVSFEKTYTYDVRNLSRDPDNIERTREIPVHYRFPNTSSHNLGDRPLTPGKIRVFQVGPDGNDVFTGEDRLPYSPIGDSITVFIGNTRDMKVRQNTVERQRINIRYDDDRDIQMYDLREEVEVKINNFKKDDVVLQVIQTINGEWEMLEASHSYEKKSNNVVTFRVPVSSQEQKTLRFRYIRRHLGKEAPVEYR